MDDPQLLARRITVRGRVQGVGFRWSTRAEASGADLSGSVRNSADGSVLVEVVGPPHAVERFTDWLRTGPPGARVTDVHVDTADDLEPSGRFEILP